MNPVARFWRALAAGDWPTAEAQMHAHAVVEWPHTGERFDSRDAFLAVHREVPGALRPKLLRIVHEGRQVATEVDLRSDDGHFSIASFFTLHDGRILHAVEYWVPAPDRDGAARRPPDR